jgi:PAS domain S-box-containing protein
MSRLQNPKEIPAMGSSFSSKQYSFLHLEDNPLDAELTADSLRAAGLDCAIKLVASRAAFNDALKSESFDLILADYSLPDFDRLAALKIVRATDRRIPFVFILGVLGEDVAVETLLSGATDYVIKQKLDRLVPAIMRALSEYAEYKSRQRAEIDLRLGEERFKKLTNSLPSMVWTCDLNGDLTFTNSLWDRNVGKAGRWYSPEVIHPSDHATCETVWREAQLQRRPFELDCRYLMANGDYHWHLVWGTPLENEGEITAWVGTCTDTEQQRIRDTQFRTAEKLALTGRMASVIAHEINNPLEAMTNLFYLLRSEVSATPQGEAFFAQVEHELLRISTITKLTLQWSREGASTSPLLARELIEETIRLFSGKLKNKKVRLHKVVDQDICINAVGGEIRQVLANLLSNAVDAVNVEGNITISAQILIRDNQPFAELAVQDD